MEEDNSAGNLDADVALQVMEFREWCIFAALRVVPLTSLHPVPVVPQ